MTISTTEGAPLNLSQVATVSTTPYREIKKAVVYLKETELDQAKAADDDQRLSNIAAKRPGFEKVSASQGEHDASVAQVVDALRAHNIDIVSVHSATEKLSGHLDDVDLIVTIGGDGTVLRASHEIGSDIAVVAVNSAPGTSFGHFCLSDGKGFPVVLSSIIDGSLQPSRLLRLSLTVNGVALAVPVLNEVQVAHWHPAGTSRFRLTHDDSHYHHKGSGMIIASPSGSTGFNRSEGGYILPICDRRYVFVERATFLQLGEVASMKRQIVDGSKSLVYVSEMKEGMLYVDGMHIEHPFPRGAVLTVSAGDSDLLAYVDPNCHDPYMV